MIAGETSTFRALHIGESLLYAAAGCRPPTVEIFLRPTGNSPSWLALYAWDPTLPDVHKHIFYCGCIILPPFSIVQNILPILIVIFNYYPKRILPKAIKSILISPFSIFLLILFAKRCFFWVLNQFVTIEIPLFSCYNVLAIKLNEGLN